MWTLVPQAHSFFSERKVLKPALFIVLEHLGHLWQTQGPWAESGPPPCFIWPGTVFLPGSSAELLAPS